MKKREGIGTEYHTASAGDSQPAHTCMVLGVPFRVSALPKAAEGVLRHLDALRGHYICFSNVHTTVTAHDDPEYMAVLEVAAIVFADGAPIAYMQRKKGFSRARRVAGPDFMEAVFAATADGSRSHFFYGATEETLTALREALLKRYPGLSIAGMHAPPFRALSEEEDARDAEMIEASGADFLWVGLGAPKQEQWMAMHQGRFGAVMCGVGAGFDFHAGRIRRAPMVVQKIGMEWLYRLCMDPKRLWKRYLVTNTKFLWYALTEKK